MGQEPRLVRRHPAARATALKLPPPLRDGYSAWSVAWNTCRPSFLVAYVNAELHMAKYLRDNLKACTVWNKVYATRTFVISGAVLELYNQVFKAPADVHYSVLKQAAENILAGERWCKRNLNVVCNCYSRRCSHRSPGPTCHPHGTAHSLNHYRHYHTCRGPILFAEQRGSVG